MDQRKRELTGNQYAEDEDGMDLEDEDMDLEGRLTPPGVLYRSHHRCVHYILFNGNPHFSGDWSPYNSLQ